MSAGLRPGPLISAGLEHRRVIAEGMRLGLHEDGTPCVSFGYCARLRYHAKRSVEIFDIFRVFKKREFLVYLTTVMVF